MNGCGSDVIVESIEAGAVVSDPNETRMLSGVDGSEECVVVSRNDLETVQVETEVSVVVESREVHVVSVGAQGPEGRQGPSGADGGAFEHNFSYGDATPQRIAIAVSGKAVYSVAVHVLIPFDGEGAAISIGDFVEPERLVGAPQVDLTQAGANETHPALVYDEDTEVNLSIIPGAGATRGSGIVVLRIQS